MLSKVEIENWRYILRFAHFYSAWKIYQKVLREDIYGKHIWFRKYNTILYTPYLYRVCKKARFDSQVHVKYREQSNVDRKIPVRLHGGNFSSNFDDIIDPPDVIIVGGWTFSLIQAFCNGENIFCGGHLVIYGFNSDVQR